MISLGKDFLCVTKGNINSWGKDEFTWLVKNKKFMYFSKQVKL